MAIRRRALEGLDVNDCGISPDFWRGKSVLVTGSTGFKGGWLVSWLSHLNARVTGYALAPNTVPSYFDATSLVEDHRYIQGDIRVPASVRDAVESCEPEVIFHLAAQPLVRESYRNPVGTWDTNVMGTLHLLEAIRRCPAAKLIVIVTSDKCYENREWRWGYRESDALGGHDPYSSSKAAVEIAVAAWRRSFLSREVKVVTVRAGNVIGGGDWSDDRLLPDAIRSFSEGESVTVRNPSAARPWQHVVEALRGYLVIAQLGVEGGRIGDAYNFGPDDRDTVSVEVLIRKIAVHWGDDAQWSVAKSAADGLHEAALLKLDHSLATAELGWYPRVTLDEAVQASIAWYKAYYSGLRAGRLKELTVEQIESLGMR